MVRLRIGCVRGPLIDDGWARVQRYLSRRALSHRSFFRASRAISLLEQCLCSNGFVRMFSSDQIKHTKAIIRDVFRDHTVHGKAFRLSRPRPDTNYTVATTITPPHRYLALLISIRKHAILLPLSPVRGYNRGTYARGASHQRLRSNRRCSAARRHRDRASCL